MPDCFLKWLCHFTFLPVQYESSNFPTSLPAFVICSLLLGSSWWVWRGMWVCFWFAFPWWLMILSRFLCVYCPFIYLLWRNVYSDPLCIVKLNYLSFYYWTFKCSLYILWCKSLNQTYDLQIIFPHSMACFLTFLMVLFLAPKFLIFM